VDGIAAKAVDKAIDNGTVFLSASGNNASISYGSEFRKGEVFSLGGFDFETHDFDPSSGIDSFQNIKVSEGNVAIRPLFSSYPNSKASDSFTLLLVDSPELPNEANIKAVSTVLPGDSLNSSLSTLAYLEMKMKNFTM
jgi:hypothetical protein